MFKPKNENIQASINELEDENDFDGKLLHQSCLWDNTDLLSDLLFGDEVKYINSQDSKGRTALHAAVISNSTKCARLLLMNGADPNIHQFYDNTKVNMSLKTCLHLAAQRGQLEMVQTLLEFNANVYAKDGNGLTAMDLADQGRHSDVVECLKNAVAVIEGQRKDWYETFALAVHKGDIERVQQLLTKVASIPSEFEEVDGFETAYDVQCYKIKSFVNYAPSGSNTLLFKACQEGHYKIVKLLIELGADGRQHPITKYSPLYISAYHGRLKICQLLLQHFPELSSVFTVEHWLPIHAAALNNHQEIVELLFTFPYPSRVMKRFLVYCDSPPTTSNLTTTSNLPSTSQLENSFNSFSSSSSASMSAKHETSTAKRDMSDYDKQFVYWMPFDINAQDIASQSVLFLATLLSNKSLVEFLVNFELQTMSYVDYINLFGQQFNVEANTSKSKQRDSITPEQEFIIVFAGAYDSRSNSFEADNDSCDGSTSSDQDVVTIIDTLKKKKATTEPQEKENVNDGSSIPSPIQRLIDKLTPSSSPTKQQTIQSPSPDSDQAKKSKRKKKSKAKLHRVMQKVIEANEIQLYSINPINIDQYGNYNTETSLHCAVRKKHYSIASLLLEKGANPSLPIHAHLSGVKPMITRVTHFNHNFFSQSLGFSNSIKDLKELTESTEMLGTSFDASTPIRSTSTDNNEHEKLEARVSNDSTNTHQHYQSNALREAVRNRDKPMVDLLLRFGARDEIIGHEENEEEEEDVQGGGSGVGHRSLESMNALSIAFSNSDFHFVSKLLSLSAFVDSEYKINKKAFDIVGSNCMNAMNKFNIINNVTVSSMFPSNAVMIDWSQLNTKSINGPFQKHLSQWLIDAALVYNVKLKLSQGVAEGLNSWNTALAAITRIDLSGNNLTSVPLSLFIDLPSLKVLNLSMNRLQTLPEVELEQKDKAIDDDTLNSLRRSTNSTGATNAETFLFSSPSQSKNLFSKMRKSQSVNTALSSSTVKAKATNHRLRNERVRGGEVFSWNLPFLEELYLQDNQLECLPSSLFQQAELKLLDLSNNKLRTLPPLFWFAPKLSELNLSLNLLCDLPSPVNCTLKMGESSGGSFDDTSRSLTKSISVMSISENASISSFGDGDSSRGSLSGRPNETSPTNLIPFDLSLTKPWSGAVNILNDLYQPDDDDKLCRNETEYSQFGEDFSSKEASITKSTTTLTGGSGGDKQQTCMITQLNLSHNGFDRVPFLLSCLATRLTHLNLSYNRLNNIFDADYILGHYPLSIKHLDLSHNQIEDWLVLIDQAEVATERLDEEEIFSTQQCCYHSTRYSDVRKCLYKQHTRLDNLKTLILTNNHLKRIVITREELFEIVNQWSVNQKTAELLSALKFNSQFHISPSATEAKSFTSRLAKKFYSTFGSMDDLASALNEDSNVININSKASRYAKLFFPNLSMLDVANNAIAEIPKTISYLCQLSVLNISGNLELTALPPEMGLLTKLWNLNTRGCVNLSEPLRSMINSKMYKTCDIISYLNSILENSKPYARMKLMLVGLQGIGKTSLLEALRHEGTGKRHRPPDHWGKRMGNKQMGMKTPKGVTLSTVGVDLYDWTYERKQLRGARDRSLSTNRASAFQTGPKQKKGSLEGEPIGPVTFRTWDFGGQKEYYATHQYFLSKRSIYLVVWKIIDGENGVQSLHSWLMNIQSRAPNSPVIIVGTHYDLIKEYYPPFFSSDLQNMIRERYMADCVDADKRGLPQVVASIEISVKTRYNIRLLANLIYDTACEMRAPGSKERYLDQKVPATYLALEEVAGYLAYERKMAGLEPVLHAEQFRQEIFRLMKERHGLKFRDYSELQQATRFLHENGVMLHYEDANLKELYFLDPQWLCDMLAHVVTIREINPYAKHGIMKTDQLVTIFKNTKTTPNDVQNYLLNLLNKFELALTWDNRTLLIPSLLPTEEELRRGQPGCDVLIPLRSRMKIRRAASIYETNSSSLKFEFINQLPFQELSSLSKSENNLIIGTDQEKTKPFSYCKVTAQARHQHSIHRILLLSYVPCGFWSRLVTRVLADETVIEIVRSFYHLPTSTHNDPALLAFLNSSKPKWHCWQSGFGLRYFDTFLLRVKELSIISPVTTISSGNVNSNRLSASYSSKPYYPYDYQRIKFYLKQQKDSSITSISHHDKRRDSKESTSSNWSEVFISNQGSSLIEIYLPNQSLQVETGVHIVGQDEEKKKQQHQNTYILEPNMEMLTKLLVILVEHIDTLLEDWYPALGTRFIHTSDGRFLITRIVPCTACMHCFVTETMNQLTLERKEISEGKEAAITSPDASEVDSFLVNFYKTEVKMATIQASQVRKPESRDSAISTLKTNENQSSGGNDKATTALSLYHSVYAFMVEECILAVYDDQRVECPLHGKLRMDRIAPDVMFCDLKDNLCIERDQLRFGKLLGRGSFGFVFRAFYISENRNQISSLKSSGNSKLDGNETSTLSKHHNVSNSTFYLPHGEFEHRGYEVALKLLQPIKIELRLSGVRKADLEAYSAMKSKWERDPLQFACKAYCTARTELNILASLKHPNIASLIGICPKPLSLVLTLAPYGSLDTHIKQFRRSGVRITPLILQQSFLQISKALEYLHQHHIIYRDLKSENVLVWSFPNLVKSSHTHYSQLGQTVVQTSSNVISPFDVQLKLADYGISRSSLPTGTKGFGGTEGFMAPEIMLFNGEEEYTEKVDCFSFAMFMYEMCTLRFPFEGQEFIIRESILDGIRPALARRDLECLPESFVDLMIRCWAQEPIERPTISQVVSIISAPEFCALRDVALLPENSALICGVAFDRNSLARDSNEINLSKRFGLCLSKIGKQIDCLESVNSKWNPVGHRLTCENLINRTITSSTVVNGSQLWLGDSRAAIHIHDLNTDGEKAKEPFKLICMIQIESENPASLTAIKSISWFEHSNSAAICLNSGSLWLLNVAHFQELLNKRNDPRVCISSNDLLMKEIISYGQIILCATFIEQSIISQVDSKTNETSDGNLIEVWCGQPEGKISIVRVDVIDLSIVEQTMIDHYADHFLKRSLASSNVSNVPLADRSVVSQLMATDNVPFVYSVLQSDFMVYQWDAREHCILHRLDCSKLAPCSESLMSISIEDHFKPGSCLITATAINSFNDELYIGTNSGCIIVAELSSLKPITVFRPYQEEVKFIIIINCSETLTRKESINSKSTNDDNKTLNEEKGSNGCGNTRNALRSLNRASSLLWPFHKNSKTSTRDKKAKGGEKRDIEASSDNLTITSTTMKKKTVKQIRPFVTIGKGYRNLLDRFITIDGGDNNKKINSKAVMGLNVLIWDSGYWNFG